MRSTLRDERGLTLVELLVVMVVLGIVVAGTSATVIATMRSNSYGEQLRQVMDEGRISLDRIRRELRGGRAILTGSNRFRLDWWVDQNQNGTKESSEVVHYCVTPLGTPNGNNCFASDPGPGKYQLVRWTDATGATAATSVARTLTDAKVFEYASTSGTAIAPGSAQVTQSATVKMTFRLDVRDDARGPDDLVMDATVRLRNVPYTL